MSFKSVLTKTAFGFVIVCGILAGLGFWAMDPLNFRAPKDEDLFSLFHDHRAAFERLRQMLTDGQAYISRDVQNPMYKRLLSEIHPTAVTLGYGGEVSLTFASGGLSAISGGWSKGILYLPRNDVRIGIVVQNLDEARKLPTGTLYLREIEPKWFIAYRWYDD